METSMVLLAAGAFGALVRTIVRHNQLVLPSFSSGVVSLGFIGGMVVGAFVGLMVDHSPLTALLSGYVGTSAISHLLPADLSSSQQSSGTANSRV